MTQPPFTHAVPPSEGIADPGQLPPPIAAPTPAPAAQQPVPVSTVPPPLAPPSGPPLVEAMPVAAMPAEAAPMSPVSGWAEPAGVDEVEADVPRADAVDVSRTVWSPAFALVLGLLALTMQLVAYYVRERLPLIQASGATIDNFDTVVGSIPFLGSDVGRFLAMAIGAGALSLALLGFNRGIREPLVQVTAGVLGAAAMLGTILLPRMFG